MRVYQTDITPDRTFDPTGAEVLYRPELDEDQGCVAAYHSTESEFLVGVLRWINQLNIPSEMLKDRGNPIIEWTKSIGHRIGNAAECFGEFGGFGPSVLFGGFDEPMSVLSRDFTAERPSTNVLGTSGEGYFGIYLGPDKELIFAYESRGKFEKQKKPAVIFQPSEADHLLKGICYQAANGLGRTVPQRLISILEYRCSERMGADMKRLRE